MRPSLRISAERVSGVLSGGKVGHGDRRNSVRVMPVVNGKTHLSARFVPRARDGSGDCQKLLPLISCRPPLACREWKRPSVSGSASTSRSRCCSVLDLTVLRREERAPSMRESILTTLVWVALAVGFGLLGGVARKGGQKGSEFFTGYVIEYSLSIDNLFLFVLIFSNFPGRSRPATPASFLGRDRRAGHARRDDRRGRRAAASIRVDHLSFRRLHPLRGLLHAVPSDQKWRSKICGSCSGRDASCH